MSDRYTRTLLLLVILGCFAALTNTTGCKESNNSLPVSTYFTGVGFIVGTSTQLVGVVKMTPSKEALSNIPVSIWNPSGNQMGSGTLTTGEGKFFLKRPSPGLYIVDVATKSTAYTPVQYPIQIFSDDTVSPPNIEILLSSVVKTGASAAAFLSGIVQLNTSKEPLGGISVDLFQGDTKVGEPTKTTAEGKFFFLKPGPGLYTLHVASGSAAYDFTTYNIQVLPDGTLSPAAPLVNVSRLSDSRQVQVATATGRVLDAFSGAPLEYVTCTLKGIGNQLTDNLGQFSFSGLIPGNYEIELSKSGFSKMNVNFTITPTGGFVPSSLVYLLIYNQETGKGSIGGRYVNETTREGVENLSVRIYEINYVAHTYTALVSRTVDKDGNVSETWTTKTEYNWEFDPTPFLVKSSHTGQKVTTIPDNSGTFKITHLAPVTATKKYFVYLGSDGSSMTARNQNLPGFQTQWNIFDGVASQSWNLVIVEADKTTYLTNYDRENY